MDIEIMENNSKITKNMEIIRIWEELNGRTDILMNDEKFFHKLGHFIEIETDDSSFIKLQVFGLISLKKEITQLLERINETKAVQLIYKLKNITKITDQHNKSLITYFTDSYKEIFGKQGKFENIIAKKKEQNSGLIIQRKHSEDITLSNNRPEMRREMVVSSKTRENSKPLIEKNSPMRNRSKSPISSAGNKNSLLKKITTIINSLEKDDFIIAKRLNDGAKFEEFNLQHYPGIITQLEEKQQLIFLSFYLKIMFFLTTNQKDQITKYINEILLNYNPNSTKFIKDLISINTTYNDNCKLINNKISNLNEFLKSKSLKSIFENKSIVCEENLSCSLMNLLYFLYVILSSNEYKSKHKDKYWHYLRCFVIFQIVKISPHLKPEFLYFIKNIFSSFNLYIFSSSPSNNLILNSTIDLSKTNLSSNLLDLLMNPSDYVQCRELFGLTKLYSQIYNSFFMTKNRFFTEKFIELFTINKVDPHVYRKLEQNLYHNYLNFNKDPNLLQTKAMYGNQLNVYKRLKYILGDKDPDFHIKWELYPFGSVTQFLGKEDSDLDLFLNINSTNIDRKVKILQKLDYDFRSDSEFEKYQLITSSRLITFKFELNGIKVDINYYGFCSVLNSTLLRIYAQMDNRFIILAYNLKILLKKYEIANQEDKKYYLNSFTWMLLLLTFLQDIIKPPVFPKLLSDGTVNNYRLEIPSREQRKNFERERRYYKPQKKIHEIISNNTDEFEVNEFAMLNFKEIYQKHISINGVNEMALSELFIEFLKFVAFYYKYDAIYVDQSAGKESFSNIGSINKFESKSTEYYYKMIYMKKLTKSTDEFILFRDPFDHRYNPAAGFGKADVFFEKLIEAYKNVITYGEI